MVENDIRWIHRLSNFCKAFSQLEKFISAGTLNEMEEQGLIKAFEYTFELGWKTLQDLLQQKGYANIVGPRPVIEQSFKDGYIEDGKGWMKMMKSRNLTSHVYNEETSKAIVDGLRSSYFDLLKALKLKLEAEKTKF